MFEGWGFLLQITYFA